MAWVSVFMSGIVFKGQELGFAVRGAVRVCVDCWESVGVAPTTPKKKKKPQHRRRESVGVACTNCDCGVGTVDLLGCCVSEMLAGFTVLPASTPLPLSHTWA